MAHEQHCGSDTPGQGLRTAALKALEALHGMVSSGRPNDLKHDGECVHCGRDNTGYEDQPCDEECPGEQARVAITELEALLGVGARPAPCRAP